MYYLKISDENENSLVYYCRNCGHTDNAPTTETICVSNTELKKNDQKFSYSIKIADFYYKKTAQLMIDRIKNETTLRNYKIVQFSTNCSFFLQS